MDKNEAVGELLLPENANRRGKLVYFKIVILPILIYIIFVLGYFHLINIAINLCSIIMMGVILIVALIFARHSAEYACCLFEQKKDEFKRDLKSYIMKSLLSIGKEQKSNGNFDEFARLYASAVINDHYALTGSGIFPMLGILGTFLSIALYMPGFASLQAPEFESEISNLLSGAGTAFYTSVYGIFLALWWIFFQRLGMSRFDKLLARQKKATAGFFWTKDEIEQRYMQESLANFAKIGVIFDYVSKEEFFKELNNSVEKKYQNFAGMLKAEEQAIKLSDEHIKQTMGTLIKAQRDQKDMTKVHSEIINVLNSFNIGLKDMQLRLSEHYMRLAGLSDDKIVRLERSVNELGNNIYKFERSLESFSDEILDKQKLLLEGFKVAMIDGMRAFREVFNDESSDDESEDIIKELKDNMLKIEDDASLALDKLETNLEDKTDEDR